MRHFLIQIHNQFFFLELEVPTIALITSQRLSIYFCCRSQVQMPEVHFLEALVSCGAKVFCETKKYKILTRRIILKGNLSATFSALHGTAT